MFEHTLLATRLLILVHVKHTCCFSSKFTFIYTKLKLKTRHTRWLSFQNDVGKMTTVFLDVVFKPFFKIVHDTGQQLTIDRTNFLTDGFLQVINVRGL